VIPHERKRRAAAVAGPVSAVAWRKRWGRGDWAAVLAEGQTQAGIQALRRHTCTGQPWGSEAFVAWLEDWTGRHLRSRPMGRPRKRPGKTAKK